MLNWWISCANVHSRGGYLGQMCILVVDILGKCAFRGGRYLGQMCIISRGGYLGQMWITMVNILLNSGERRRRKISGFCIGKMGVPAVRSEVLW